MSVRLLLAPLLLLLALLLTAAAPAPAHAQGKSDPTELWEAFPLDPSPSPTPAKVAAAPRRETVRVVARDERPSTLEIVSLMLLAAGIGAMAVSLARGRARARARGRPAATEPAAAKPQPAAELQRAPAKPQPAPPAKLRPAPAAPPPARIRPAPAPAAKRPDAPVKPPAPPSPWKAEQTRRVKPPAPPAPRKAEKPRAPLPSIAAAAPPQPAAPGWQVCRIRLWSGYIKKQFYAESPGGGAWIAQSPFFRVEDGQTIDESRHAAEAFEALVDVLVAGGWEITGRRRGWHLWLRRPTGAARPAVRQPVE